MGRMVRSDSIRVGDPELAVRLNTTSHRPCVTSRELCRNPFLASTPNSGNGSNGTIKSRSCPSGNVATALMIFEKGSRPFRMSSQTSTVRVLSVIFGSLTQRGRARFDLNQIFSIQCIPPGRGRQHASPVDCEQSKLPEGALFCFGF